jgi:hypothetical protein
MPISLGNESRVYIGICFFQPSVLWWSRVPHAASSPWIERFAAEAAWDGAGLIAFAEYATYEKKVGATNPEFAQPLDDRVYHKSAENRPLPPHRARVGSG